MGLTPEQLKVLETIRGVGQQVGATPKMLKAAVEAGLVESNLRNLNHGDGTSIGWRQETASSYPNVNRLDVAGAARRFFAEAKPLRGKVGSAAQLAQAVQRSAFPERYGKVAAQASRLIGQVGVPQGTGGPLAASAGAGAAGTPDNMGAGSDALALLQAFGQQSKGPRPTAGLPAPAFSAAPAMPTGAQIPQGGAAAPAQPDINALLAQIQTTGMGIAKAPAAGQTSQGAAAADTPAAGAVGGSPIAGVKPHAATHETMGLPGYPAYDYMAKAGTKVLAPATGTIVKLSGSDPSNGPSQGPHGPFGYSIYVRADDGTTYYLTHLGSRNVKVGQRVGEGAVIGSIGDYAKYGGADHVHMGVKRR